MILNISGIKIYFDQYLNSSGDSKNKRMFFLHGFTGSSKDWGEIVPKLSKDFDYYLIDLPGHGDSDSPGEKHLYEAESLTEILKEFIGKITDKKIFLTGYSMGGRLAVSFSIKFPEIIDGLILESTTAGIKNENERNERIKKDEALAEFIENNSVEEFIDLWMNMEIFNTQKRFSNSKLKEIKKSKLNNSKAGLSNFLRGFSTGKMPNYSGELKNLKSKTLLITGDLDEKFTLINKEMLSFLPNAKHIIIKNSGHNTHLETPDSFIKAANNFLNQF